jgi:hypothetical protein
MLATASKAAPMRGKKKACPGKSRPLLTYEKHQVQISLFGDLPVNLFGQLAKCLGLWSLRSRRRRSRRISPLLLHLAPLHLPLDESVEILLRQP